MNREELYQAVKDAGSAGITIPEILARENIKSYNKKNETLKAWTKLRALERYGVITSVKPSPGAAVIWVAVI